MARRSSSPPGCPLTDRQHEILLALLRGGTGKQVARELGITPSAVRSHTHYAYRRLGVADVKQAMAVMLREGWVEVDGILADYEGARYSTDDQGKKHTDNWLPSPAQRLYLDAFDRLLQERTDEAAACFDAYFTSLCCERRIADRRRGARHVDAMLTKLVRVLTR